MGLLGKLLGFDEGAGKRPVSIGDDNFDAEVLQSELPVVLDVWSSTCAPCRKLEPVILELARNYDGRVKICEMNASSSPQALSRLKVRGTPTVLYIRDGKELDRIVGFRSSLYHRQAIEELFSIPPKG